MQRYAPLYGQFVQGAKAAILMERSTEIVFAQLAINRAGMAWIPLDASAPPERLRTILEDSGAVCLFTQRPVHARLAMSLGDLGAEVIFVESLADGSINSSTSMPRSTPSQTSYIIYTSGASPCALLCVCVI